MTVPQPTGQHPTRRTTRPGWDAWVLAVLVIANLQIMGLAEAAALPFRVQDVLRHPVLGALLSPAGYQAMGEIGPRPGDPLGLLLNAVTLGLLLLYFLVDLAWIGRRQVRAKWLLLALILTTALVLPTTKLMLLRAQSGPASYAHDGGVIQTESTIQFLLEGKNPYVEDYTETPMAEWGFSEYRTALYHYPYLPWTFIFSAPFFLLGNALGGYDQRLVYLLLLVIALPLVTRLTETPRRRLALVALLGLNPIMALDVAFGQNDLFVLAWILLSLVSWRLGQDAPSGSRRHRWGWIISALLFGLACASKPTAWFFAPFYGLLLIQDQLDADGGWAGLLRAVPAILGRAWPALTVFGLLLLPYLLWDWWALYDDVWRWSSGQGETGYQIWGWGASNFVLALGLVADRFGQWPFWALEILLALPVLLWFLHRQQRENTLANATWHYGVFVLVFFYGSRFLNENYLGYILAFLTLGILTAAPDSASEQLDSASAPPSEHLSRLQ